MFSHTNEGKSKSDDNFDFVFFKDLLKFSVVIRERHILN